MQALGVLQTTRKLQLLLIDTLVVWTTKSVHYFPLRICHFFPCSRALKNSEVALSWSKSMQFFALTQHKTPLGSHHLCKEWKEFPSRPEHAKLHIITSSFLKNFPILDFWCTCIF